ncbi:MAG: secondary thiamine-phosphate synthase enzyme YjbQ [Stappiaceae bacterium]
MPGTVPKFGSPEIWTLEDDVAPVRQKMARLVMQTNPRSAVNITEPINRWLREVGGRDGLLTLFLRHTSASLAIQENTDPDVLKDLLDAFDLLAPADRPWRHSLEGPDDMPAHIKSVLAGPSIAIPTVAGNMDLGTWQAVYLIEHRAQPHQRSITLHYIGG